MMERITSFSLSHFGDDCGHRKWK